MPVVLNREHIEQYCDRQVLIQPASGIKDSLGLSRFLVFVSSASGCIPANAVINGFATAESDACSFEAAVKRGDISSERYIERERAVSACDAVETHEFITLC